MKNINQKLFEKIEALNKRLNESGIFNKIKTLLFKNWKCILSHIILLFMLSGGFGGYIKWFYNIKGNKIIPKEVVKIDIKNFKTWRQCIFKLSKQDKYSCKKTYEICDKNFRKKKKK